MESMKRFLVICCITLALIPHFINADNSNSKNQSNEPSQFTTNFYEDKRCKCICPSINAVLNNTDSTERILVIANVGQARCDCDSVILPKYADKIKGKEQEFCPRCECKHENRNTTVIKVVVIIVIWIISLLSIYMLFLNLLEPLLNKRSKQNYQEHLDEDDASSMHQEANAHNLPMVNVNVNASRSNVLNRVTNQQDKWKRQVQEQRQRIYDRHSMLN